MLTTRVSDWVRDDRRAAAGRATHRSIQRMADDKNKIPEEVQRQRRAQFGRIAAWTEPQPRRAPVDEDDRDEPASAEAS